MSYFAWLHNCFTCAHAAQASLIEAGASTASPPCPQDHFGNMVGPKRVRRVKPPDYVCPRRVDKASAVRATESEAAL